MIDLDFVERLIRTVDESSIDHVEIERGGTRVLVSKTPRAGHAQVGHPAPAAAPPPPPAAGHNPSPPLAPVEAAPAPPAPTSTLVDITSPMVGTFYRSPSPDSPAFVEVGKAIKKGDPLCIIEAMKLMNELEAEIEGTIREVCIENGQPVEYGQVLFRVDP